MIQVKSTYRCSGTLGSGLWRQVTIDACPMLCITVCILIVMHNRMHSNKRTFTSKHKFGLYRPSAVFEPWAHMPKLKEQTWVNHVQIFQRGTVRLIEWTQYELISSFQRFLSNSRHSLSLVSGYLAQLVQGGTVEECICKANYAANYVIQLSGCSLPTQPNFSEGAAVF